MNKTIKAIGIGTLIFLGSAFGGYLQQNTSPEEKKTLETRINMSNQPVDSIDVKKFFSGREKFKQLPGGYWEKRKGFKFIVDESRKVENYGKVGSAYEFSVGGVLEGSENLIINNYNRGIFPKSLVFLSDKDHDGKIDNLYLSDKVNNTEINIRRNRNGILESVEVDEKNMAILFDIYSTKYTKFFQENNLSQLINDYSPKLEINETKISNK